MTLEKLEKRYKTYRWVQYISFALSILSCFAPLAVACIRVVPNVNTGAEKWSLAGISVVVAVIIAAIAMRSLVQKYIHKLPYTLIVLIAAVMMLVSVVCLKRIIDDAIAILWFAAISSAVAFTLELVSMLCKVMAEHAREEYRRIDNV